MGVCHRKLFKQNDQQNQLAPEHQMFFEVPSWKQHTHKHIDKGHGPATAIAPFDAWKQWSHGLQENDLAMNTGVPMEHVESCWEVEFANKQHS